MPNGLSASVTAVGGLGSALVLVSLWLWRENRGFRDKYDEAFEEMQDYYWSKFSSNLGSLVHKVLAEYLEDDFLQHDDQDLPTEGVIVSAIESDVTRDELEDVENSLREFDKTADLHERAKNNYRDALTQLGFAGILFIVVSVVMALVPPSDGIWLMELGVGFLASLAGVSGIVDFKRGWDCEQKVDDLIDDYKRNY